MEIERPELRADGGAPSSSVARYLSDAGLSRTHSYEGSEDQELQIRCRHLREIADRIELAHSRMLNEHDRRALAIAEQAPYACFIPFYPELPSENGQINHTAQLAQSVDKNKKRKKESGSEVIQVKPTMQWSKWPCVWCSVNFDSKEAMDAHLQEQHQGCQGDVASESEKVEKNRSEEARTGLAVTSDGNQMEISDGSEPHASKKIHLDLSPSNIKQKHDKENKDEVVPVLENKENIGSNTSKKMKLVVPPLNLKRKSHKHKKEVVVPTPENKEITGSHADKKIKLDLRPSKKKPDEVRGEEFVQSPQNKEIANSNINRNMKLDFPSSNSKQKSDEPNKEKVVPTSETEEIACSSNNKKTKLDLPILNLKKKSVSTIRNGSQKSNSTNRMVTEKPVQGACQAESVPKLEGPKEIHKDPSKEEVVQTPESQEIYGFSNNTRGSCANPSKPDEPSKEEVMPIPGNKEIAGFSNNTRGSCANPSKPDEPSKEEVMPTPENKEIAGFSTNVKVQVDLPTLNLEQKSAQPNKALQTPRNKETAGSSIQSTIPTRHKGPAIGTTTKRTLDEHFEDNDNNKKLKAPLNERKKSKPANRMVTGKSVQRASQAASVLKLEDPKEETSKSVTLPKPEGTSQAASVSKLEDPKEQTSKSVPMPKPVQGTSQAASTPKLVKPKEAISKSIPMPQANKLKEVTSHDKESPSLKSRIAILSGHKKTAQTAVEFSEKRNYVSVNGTTMPMLVMKDGKWFCNLCQAKWMTERCKEEHINGKRHWLNLQAQDVSCRSEPAEPVMVMTDGTTKPVLVMTDGNWFCNLCKTKQMSENVKEQHINSRRHKQNLEAQAVSYRPEPAKPPTRLHWCFLCNIICTTEDNLIAHYNGKQHREVLMNGFRGGFS